MNKYIDADALIEELRKTFYIKASGTILVNIDDVLNVIDEIPAADAEPVERWISVDERLPETRIDKEYRGGNFTGEPREVIEHTVSDQVLVAIEDWHNRIIIDIDFMYDGEWDGYGERDVIAWMPLPEPPKMDGGSK